MKYLLKRREVTLMKTKGWQQVFKFTFLQMIKSKSYIVSTIIIVTCLLLMSLGINFLPGLLTQNNEDIPRAHGGERGAVFGITTLYLSNRSLITPSPDFSYLSEFGIEVIYAPWYELAGINERVRTSREPEIFVQISKHLYGYEISVSRPEYEGIISASDCKPVLDMMSDTLWRAHMIFIGVPEENIDEVAIDIHAHVIVAGESPRNEMAVLLANTIIPMVSSMILFLFIFTYGSLTAQAIATEKTSRVMETLLTSVRPMAVILGKVLGMGLASFTQFFALAAVGFGVSAVVAPFGALGQVFGSVEIEVDDFQMQMFRSAFDEAFAGFNVMSIVWIIIIFLLGFLFYSLLAGLFGATISRIEDLQSALTPLSLIGVLGFYLAYVAPAFSIESGEVNIVQRFSYYFPISSPFALPGVIISGEMGTVGALVSVGFLALCCVLMLMFVSRIYETIITSTGNRITIGAMFKMAKNK
jgi:ABC-2 type transport system permease protein